MAKATVKEVRFGKTTIEGSTEGGDAVRNIYCQSKSGNVYALCKKVPEDVGFYLMERIRKAGVIDTKQWVKIREGEKPQRKAAPAPKQSNAPRPEMTYSMKDEFGNPVTLIVDNRLPLLRGVWA